MGKTSDGEQTFPPAKILVVGPLVHRYTLIDDGGGFEVITPLFISTVITTNGQIWDIPVLAFAAPTQEEVIGLWETRPEQFIRRATEPKKAS